MLNNDDLLNGNSEQDYGKYKNESYILTVRRTHGLLSDNFYIFVPDRRSLTELMNLMKQEEYIILDVRVFNCKIAEELIKEMKNREKPDNLNFG